MTAIIEARKTYEGAPRQFEKDLAWHLQHGYVWSCPDAFIMGRPVNSKKPDLFHDLSVPQEGDRDCWFIFLAAGLDAFRYFIRIMPYPLVYLAWHRRGDQLRIHKLQHFLKRI